MTLGESKLKKTEYVDNLNYSPKNMTQELKELVMEVFKDRDKAEVISKETIYSNCYIEALKRKLKNPFNVKVKLSINKNTYVRTFLFDILEVHVPPMIHCMWTDGKYDYEFTNYNKDRHKGVKETNKKKKIRKPFVIHGVIKRYPLGYIDLQNSFLKKWYKLNNNGKKWLSIGFNTDDVIKWRRIKKK